MSFQRTGEPKLFVTLLSVSALTILAGLAFAGLEGSIGGTTVAIPSAGLKVQTREVVAGRLLHVVFRNCHG